MFPCLSSFEYDILYAVTALHKGAPVSSRLRDYFAAFDGALDKTKRFTLITPSSNTLRLFYNKAALPSHGFPREEFNKICVSIKKCLLQIANFIIKLEEEKLIIPEYKPPQFIKPSQEQALPWRVYNEFFPDEAPPILYIKSLKPIPTKELYVLLESNTPARALGETA
ncbi:MAG: hypothetical protein LBG74_00110 [Spirochaetaceae bacterium]|jgi:hypothetical protein|nr:hypothetical protein [Spirochaetaceae bacterium]